MSLSSIHLDAFSEICRVKNFTKAAENLHVTQSALTQRIQNLEEDLETTLLVRDRTGIRITEAGERLLRYCQMRERLEEEAVGELKAPTQKEIAGVLRVGGYSSVIRSVLMPALSKFVVENPKVQLAFEAYEMNELEEVLLRGDADLIVIDYESRRQGFKSDVLGDEEYVIIEPKVSSHRNDTYLDHDPADQATFDFFRAQGKKVPEFHRAYFGDVYGILDGVKLGYGRAVMSKHLIQNEPEIRIVKGFKSRTVKVRLTYFDQPYYSKVQQRVIDELKNKAPQFL